MIFRRSSEKKPGLFERMKQAIGATKNNLVARIESVLSGRPTIDENLLEELEGVLLGADLGVRATEQVLKDIREQHKKQLLKTPDDVRAAIRKRLLAILHDGDRATAESEPLAPQIWMIVGVNGTGKTTTVGKLAAKLSQEGRKVLICAADTFRAAAIEQLAVWAERSGVEIIKSKSGSDPSAVLHDALAAALARKLHVVLIDTAGRLHTRSNLMQELEKMRRVAGRVVAGAPHETLLVLDATTGQNGLVQAREFLRAAGVTGLIVTKLDGTAKGGVLFSIAQDLKIPVRFVGVGESIEDLMEFSPEVFVDSLFSDSAPSSKP
ncbi:MAG: signal recognition particle-docking protein FtsY [Acidobacteria bacterium]|nr:MAG: signal recognition particle-docking protein FtsY [Acidobacteriota bacterium]